MAKETLPTQNQLVLPLLEILEESPGGKIATPELYDAIADRLDLDAAARERTVEINGCAYRHLDRHVRFAQQRAKLLGLAVPVGDKTWQITGQGREALKKALPGLVVTVFETPYGVALFGHAEDAVGYIDDGALRLIFSSPPYPLIRQKEYGNKAEREYVDWFLRIAEQWPRKLARDGSVVLNLADVWMPGQPTLSLYQERLLIALEEQLGLHLCQRFAWENPSKMPAPAEWVTIRRVRVKNSLEQIFWLSPDANPKGSNLNVLKEYSESMRGRLAAGGEKGGSRPSGYDFKEGAFGRDAGGAIPGNLLVAANTESNSSYIRSCKENGLPVHPARFPAALPEFFIRMLTDEGDTVYDPFGGSLMTGKVAETLKRYWIASEVILEYLQGARHRFESAVTQPLLDDRAPVLGQLF